MSDNRGKGSRMSADREHPAVVRVRVIRQSLRCFAWAWVGIIPLVGLPFAFRAFVESNRAVRSRSVTWNPAERYRVAGVVLARIGVVATVLCLGALWVAVTGGLR